ncbi:hypothetical protein [Algibacter aquimarinus]|uniref:SGNH/GDSL hydrolase family protein n=1 Tax=Algibacter aquimarinus TaxID=1136748 RepID=A0ABP9HKT5_9FLAO
MKKFLIKLFVFAVLFFAFDKLFIYTRNILPEHDTLDNRLDLVFKGKINKDLILMGSSVGDTDLLPHAFQDSLNLSTYNLSYGAAAITYQKFILENLLKHNSKPKIIIKLITNDTEFYGSSGVNDMGFRLDRLYPVIKYKTVRDELVIREDINPILSQFMVLSHFKKQHVIDLIKPKQEHDDYYNEFGTEVFKDRHDSLGKWSYNKNPKYDFEKENLNFIEDFIEFQKICKVNNIKLIYAVAPTYMALNKELLQIVKNNLLGSTNLFVYDYSNKAYKDKFNFADPLHMNPKGAIIYTNELIEFTKTILEK